MPTIPDALQMLNGPGDANREVQIRADRGAGRADLAVATEAALIDRNAARAGGGAQGVRQPGEQRDVGDTVAGRGNDVGLLEPQLRRIQSGHTAVAIAAGRRGGGWQGCEFAAADER